MRKKYEQAKDWLLKMKGDDWVRFSTLWDLAEHEGDYLAKKELRAICKYVNISPHTAMLVMREFAGE